MKVIFFPAESNMSSGAFCSMVKLTEILKKRYGHDVLVVLPYKGEGSAVLEQCGVRNVVIRSFSWVFPMGEEGRPLRILKNMVKRIVNATAVCRATALLKREQADLVHINTLHAYVGARAAELTSTPFVWHLREVIEVSQKLRIWGGDEGRGLLQKAAHAIAVSEYVYERYAAVFGKEKTSVIYNGIDPGRFISGGRRLFPGPVTELVIVGGIYEGKGQRVAIDACIKLHDGGTDSFRLSIVGEGEKTYVCKLEQYVRERGAEKYIRFCGRVNEPEKCYKSADVLLMCTEGEAFGRVTVEAMMSGALVIGANSGGTRELIAHNRTGLLFTCGDADSLAAQIAFALAHPDKMRAVAQNGTAYAMKHFTADKNAEEVNALYSRLMPEIDRGGIRK